MRDFCCILPSSQPAVSTKMEILKLKRSVSCIAFKVVKAGRHGDPIEIVVTRSTVTSPPTTDDEGDGQL